jgi:hypothetical protein
MWNKGRGGMKIQRLLELGNMDSRNWSIICEFKSKCRPRGYRRIPIPKGKSR